MEDTPPFCPNRDCPTRVIPPPGLRDWYLRAGFRFNLTGPVQRFRCRWCGKGFSSRTFDIGYWTHREVDASLIRVHAVAGTGLRRTSRLLGVSTSLLRHRHRRLGLV